MHAQPSIFLMDIDSFKNLKTGKIECSNLKEWHIMSKRDIPGMKDGSIYDT